MAEISAETMRDLIDYNPETGRLLWKERPVSLFTEKRHAATWNKRFAGRDALSARDKAGYLQGMVMRAPIKAHRAAWAIFHGEWPKLHIDHINGDRSDNRISNLREVTVSENLRNRRPNKFRKSGLPPGVVMARNGRFYAQVKTSAGRVMSSTFDTAMEAGAEYLNLCSEHGFHENHGKPLSEIAQDADQ